MSNPAMEEEEYHMDELRHQFKAAAKAFIKQTTRANEGNPEWDSRQPERHEHWLKSTENVRSNIAAGLFEYADRRSRGLEPPPGQYTWVDRSVDQRGHDLWIRQLGIKKPDTVGTWREVDWSKSSPRDQEHEPSPSQPAEPDGRFMRSDSPDKHLFGKQEYQSLPKALINGPPEKIKDNDMKSLSRAIYQTQAQQWEQNLRNPEKDTEMPAGFSQHPDRPWTEEDEEQLLDIIESGEHDFARISQQVERTEDECHQKYRYLACLEVKEPRVGVWSAQQEADLVRFVEEYKMTDWDRIAFHCGTTTEEARKHWMSRKPITPSQSIKHSNAKAASTLAVTSATNNAMMNALDDAFVSDGSARDTSRSPRAVISSQDDSSSDDQSPRGITCVQREKSKSEQAAASSSTKAWGEVRSTMAGGRKRGFAEFEEVDEGATASEQPKLKVRRTETAKSGLMSKMAKPVSVQILRRSSRLKKGVRKYGSDFLWYDPNKTKSLSQKGLSNNFAPRSAAKQARSKGDKALTASKGLHQGSEPPIIRNAPRGKKRSRMDSEDFDEGETSRRKTRRTSLPKSSLKIRIQKNASGGAQVASIARTLQGSSRAAQQAADPLKSGTRLVAAPTRNKSGRGYAPQVYPEAGALEEGVSEKMKHNARGTALGKKAINNTEGSPRNEQVSMEKTPTTGKNLGRRQKRGREAESDSEEDPPRKFQKGSKKGTSDSAHTLNPERLRSNATNPLEASERPMASTETERPLLQLRKPRHRAGLDRRMGNYPSTRTASKRL